MCVRPMLGPDKSNKNQIKDRGGRMRRSIWVSALVAGIVGTDGVAAAQFTFNLALQFTGSDGVGMAIRRVPGEPDSNFVFSLPVGWQGATVTRSVLDFDITRLPETEKVKSARLELVPTNINIQGLDRPVGSIVDLDARAPLPPGPLAPTAPSDPRRFSFDAIGAAPVITSLGLGGAFGAFNPFDVTSAITADHRAGSRTSPLGLMDNPDRRFSLGVVSYTQARLIVETETPSPVRFSLEALGANRYRAHYSLFNEVSLPLGLLDIELDPALYREDTLSVSLTDGAAADWSALLLDSGIGVPAVLSLAHNGTGLTGGARATGFSIDFDWLGAGRPGAQRFTVYDPSSFDTLYSGTTAPVPLPPAAFLLLSALGALARCRTRQTVATEQPS